MRDEVPREHDGRGQVDGDFVDDLVVAEGVERLEAALVLDPGVDPHGVDVGVLGQQGLCVLGDRGQLAVIHGVGFEAGQFFGEGGEAVFAPPCDDDLFAHFVEGAGEGFTYASGAAEDEDFGHGGSHD